MKKIISVVLCLAVTLSCAICPSTANAAEDTMEAVVWEDFSRSTKGKTPKTSQFRATEEEGSVTTVDSLGAIGSVNAMKMSYSSLRGYHNITGDQGFWLVYDKAKSLKSITDIMYYVKMPLSKADNEGNNWGKSGVGLSLYLGGYSWVQPKNGAKLSYLAKNSNEWKTVETQGMYFDLPTGFEGYIKIAISDFTTDSLNDDIHNYSVEESLFQFSNMGAQCGDAYVNAAYGISKDADGTMIQLNGDKIARFLTTGAKKSETNSKLSGIAMKAEVLQDFHSYPVGYDLIKHDIVNIEHKTDVLASLVKSVGGVLKTPSIELSSKTLGGFHDTDPYYDVKYPANTYIDDMKAFVFYIKCAESHPSKPDSAAVRFNLHTEKNGEQTWTLLGKSTVKAMRKGTGVWNTYSGSGDGNGIVYLPADFEGYVMVEIQDMLTNPIADDLKDRMLISSTFQFQAVGGECGNGYIGPMYMITELENKNTRLITFNDCDVYSLSTDSYASENDLLNIGPKIDYTYDAFPANTIEQYPSVKSVTESSAVVFWDSIEGADNYRIDVYCDYIQDESYAYLCTRSLMSDSCELKITDLEKGVRYYFVVTALNNAGSEVAVLKHQRFITEQEGTELTDMSVTQTIPYGADNLSRIMLIIAMGSGVLLLGTMITLVLINKRKERMEE